MKHGPFSNLFTIVMMTLLVILVSCTGQSPADLKNKITSSEEKLSQSCYGIKLDGELLTKTNIVKIFECGTWKDQFPDFYEAIKEIPEKDLNSLLAPYNKHIFYDRLKQGKLLNIVSAHSQEGHLEHLGSLLSRALGDYKLLSQLDLVLRQSKLIGIDRSLVLNVFSKNQKDNISAIKALGHFLDLYHQDRSSWDKIFSSLEREVLISRGVTTLDHLANLKTNQAWIGLSQMLDTKNSYGLRNWAKESLHQPDANSLLLALTGHSTLVQDSFEMNAILKAGMICKNAASSSAFNIRADKELVTKMTDLAELDRDGYQRSVVDGVSKLIAFKNFCQSDEVNGYLDIFSRITDTIMVAADIERDYKFIQAVQKTFPEGNEFGLLDFLSGKTFEVIHLTLSEISNEGLSLEFSDNAFQLISSLDENDFNFISEITQKMASDGPVRAWYLNWSKMWNQLTVEEKHEFVNLLSIVFDKDIDSSKSLRIILDIVQEFPEVTSAISDQFDESSFYDSLRNQVEILSKEKVREDISRFLSNDGLVAFLKVFTRGRESSYKSTSAYTAKRDHEDNLVILSSVREKSLQRQCYDKLNEDYQKGVDYYTVVNTLPSVCLDSLGEFGLVGQIYLWMNSLNQKFIKESGKEFHSGLGVWGPGMLQFIFSGAVRADKYLGRSEGLGVKAWLPKIQEDLENKIVKERINLVLDLSKEIAEKTNILNLVVKEISERSDERFKKEGTALLNITGVEARPYIQHSSSQIDCASLNQELGVSTCLSPKQVKEGLYKILSIMKRKNENGESVVKKLFGALHPERGILLPKKGKKQERHVITLEEIIRFSQDLNSTQTKKDFSYFTKNGEKKHSGTSIERLEVIIRDISFLNNFYGAYFKNTVSQAEDYREKLEDSQRLMNWLQKFSGPFRSLGVFPKETKWLLKNARHSYTSLIEVSDEYPQVDGGTRNYADFIQSVLMIASSTSPLKSQDFGAFRKPNTKLVENHNGEFITEVTKLSGLRHLSAWVESRLGDNYAKILSSDDFQRINKNLFKKISPEKMEQAGEYLLDTYFKDTNDNLALVLGDFIDWLYQADKEEIRAFESLVAKILILASQDEVSGDDFVTLAEYLELAIKNWKTIKSVWTKDLAFSELIKLGEEVMDKMMMNKSDSSYLAHSAFEMMSKIKKTDREKLFDRSTLSKLISFLKHLSKDDIQANFDWSSVLSFMFFSDEVKISPLKTMLSEMLKYPQREILPLDYIRFLSQTENGRTRYELLVEEVFTTQRVKLEKFLETTFQALQ